jgi:hypothetical protein
MRFVCVEGVQRYDSPLDHPGAREPVVQAAVGIEAEYAEKQQ